MLIETPSPGTCRALSATLLAALLLSLAACSDTEGTAELNCGRGTIQRGNECVPSNNDDEEEDAGDEEEDAGNEDSGGTDTSDSGATDTGSTTDATTDTGGRTCAEGSLQCSVSGVPQECVDNTWIDQAPCASNEVCLVGLCTAGAGCTPGEVIGCSSDTEQLACNAAGTAYEAVTCTAGPFCFEGVCSTIRCAPDTTRCADDFQIEICDDSGELWNPGEVCDRRGGRVCAGGECVSGCAAVAKDSSYIGCEYWSLDLPQYEDPTTAGPAEPHAIVVGNVSDFPATISVQSFSEIAAPAGITVDPGTAGSITFPRADVDIIPALTVNGSGISSRSFRVTTTEPIVAYQFNPLNNDRPLYSNDASLLIPVNGIGRQHYIMGWPGGASALGFKAQRGFLTILATASGTTSVTVTASCNILNGPGVSGLSRGATQTFSLSQGQVLNLEAESTLSFPPRPENSGDLTGSYVEADKPIIVFAGHEQAVIGEDGEDGNCCADHMEEQIYPISAWGNRYLAIHSPPRGTEPDYWRVMAAQNGTSIVTTPPISGLNGEVLNAGEFVEVNTNQSFEIAATGPILVGQYLVSQQSVGVEQFGGDPSFILAVPVEGYRDNYVFLTPSGYDRDYVTVIRPTGVDVVLDGSIIPAASFRTVGTLNFEYAWIEVEPGSHQITATQPFAIGVYGYDGAVSYGFPGGLNLAQEEDAAP